MNDTGIPRIDRGVVSLDGKTLDLRRHVVMRQIVEYMIARPDQIATIRDLAINQYGADAVASWDETTTDRIFHALRSRLKDGRPLLAQKLGGEWFRIVDRKEIPPRYELLARGRPTLGVRSPDAVG